MTALYAPHEEKVDRKENGPIDENHSQKENAPMKCPTAVIVPALLLLASACRAESKTEDDIRRSVVRIHAAQRYPNLLKPWMKYDARQSSGSGVVIDGQRILTNAHVVLYAKQIYVEPYQSSDKLAATIERVDHDLDLAVLKVDDANFWKSRPAMRKAPELPETKEAVSVYGYPVGGSSLAVTKGAVARISHAFYGSGLGLIIQIDAAVNPGNSGGPVLVKDQMIGLATLSSSEGQHIGYVVPNEEIDGFLKMTAGQKGKPFLLDSLQVLQNDALRSKLKLAPSVRGLLVRAPASSKPSYPLKKGDVLTRIGSYDIDNDGMIRVKDNLRLSFAYVVPKLAVADRVPVTVWRQGRSQTIDLPVARDHRLLLSPLSGKYPSYFVYGPLVFSPASAELLRLVEGHLKEESPMLTRWNEKAASDGEELVVTTALLTHRIGKGYADPTGQVVKEVNGTRIRNLRHLVETLRKLTDQYVEFEFYEKHTETLVFDRKQVLAAMDEILSDNNIGQPCSADLRDAWKAAK
jgi:S1-C subfamily serine protease